MWITFLIINVFIRCYNLFMKFSFLTYNTLFNSAYLKLEKIIDKYHPDILCLQEVNTDINNLKLIESKGYLLADYMNSFIKFGKIYGVATFYNPEKFKFISSKTPKININPAEFFFSLFQILTGINKPKSILKCDFIDKKTKKKLIVCNAHLIVIASNGIRINHLKKAFNTLNIDKNTPMIIGGDFNYLPYQRKKLEQTMKKYYLIEATKNIRETYRFALTKEKMNLKGIKKIILNILDKLLLKKMKNDYIFYRKLNLLKTEKINIDFSDHFPIISTFSFKKK